MDGLDQTTATVSDVLDRIRDQRPNVVYETPLTHDPAHQREVDTTLTLDEQGIQHGSMVYCRVDPATCADVRGSAAVVDGAHPASAESSLNTAPTVTMKRIIQNGKVQLVPSSELPTEQDRGFRKGMMALRDMKMQWTLNDFVALDSQYEFKIKRQEQANCQQVSLNTPSITDFQAYLQQFSFQQKRFGYCYGRFVQEEDPGTRPKTIIEAIYEPPQQVDTDAAEGFEVLDDPDEETVEKIAHALGLKRVGWIFGHEPREKDLVFTSAELIMAAELQLEAAGSVDETTPFVSLKVTRGLSDGIVSVEAFQMSQQCLAMVAEEALEIGSDPRVCVVNETFTAIQEGKESKTVANDFFLNAVPIVQHSSDTFICDFPKLNRGIDVRAPSHESMKQTLQKAGQAGWTFEDRLSDFNLLIYLSNYLEQPDLLNICQSLSSRTPLDDGYKLIIKSMAGMDGSY